MNSWHYILLIFHASTRMLSFVLHNSKTSVWCCLTCSNIQSWYGFKKSDVLEHPRASMSLQKTFFNCDFWKSPPISGSKSQNFLIFGSIDRSWGSLQNSWSGHWDPLTWVECDNNQCLKLEWPNLNKMKVFNTVEYFFLHKTGWTFPYLI